MYMCFVCVFKYVLCKHVYVNMCVCICMHACMHVYIYPVSSFEGIYHELEYLCIRTPKVVSLQHSGLRFYKFRNERIMNG